MNITLVIKGMPGRWDEIINKYGVRIGNGDKISGQVEYVDTDGFHIIASAIGGDNSYPDEKRVMIETEDVSFISVVPGEWMEVGKDIPSLELVE